MKFNANGFLISRRVTPIRRTPGHGNETNRDNRTGQCGAKRHNEAMDAGLGSPAAVVLLSARGCSRNGHEGAKPAHGHGRTAVIMRKDGKNQIHLDICHKRHDNCQPQHKHIIQGACMNIAVTAAGESLNSPVFGEFARAESLSALLARNSARGPWALSSRDFSILHAHAGYGVLSLSKKTGLSPSSVSAGFRFLRGAPGMKKKRGVVEE